MSLVCCRRLPLYEGVDWNKYAICEQCGLDWSPSLRGSGLKSGVLPDNLLINCRLPLYEGVDWNCSLPSTIIIDPLSPSLRGSGLKFHAAPCKNIWLYRLPLYEGVDWNIFYILLFLASNIVSLFTREWIEIEKSHIIKQRGHRLPLYEGVDWNLLPEVPASNQSSLPLYEGVDWNSLVIVQLTVSWMSPSLRGSGLKSKSESFFVSQLDVSLFTREWIEIPRIADRSANIICLPLYEGVDWNVKGRWLL